MVIFTLKNGNSSIKIIAFFGVFVKSQLGNKSTFNSLVISQPKNIGKKSTFNLLVLCQPRYIEMKIQPLIHWHYNSYWLVKSQLCIIKYKNCLVWSPPSPYCQYLLYWITYVLNLWENSLSIEEMLFMDGSLKTSWTIWMWCANSSFWEQLLLQLSILRKTHHWDVP